MLKFDAGHAMAAPLPSWTAPRLKVNLKQCT